MLGCCRYAHDGDPPEEKRSAVCNARCAGPSNFPEGTCETVRAQNKCTFQNPTRNPTPKGHFLRDVVLFALRILSSPPKL